MHNPEAWRLRDPLQEHASPRWQATGMVKIWSVMIVVSQLDPTPSASIASVLSVHASGR